LVARRLYARMICSHCKKRILLSHRPGVFLAIAGIAACVAGAAWTFLAVPYGIAVGASSALIALISMGGVLTKMTDASAWVYSKMKRRGVECDSCHHINSIHPWSV